MKSKITLLLLLIMLLAVPLYAGEGTAGDYFSGMGRQVVRGTWNILSSPAELPCTIQNDMSQNAGTGFFTGFGKGTLFMLRRIVVGVAEVGTFIIPDEATLLPVCTKNEPAAVATPAT